jgi:hypothetical protein
LIGCALGGPSAGASGGVLLILNESVQATTTLATLGETVKLAPGTFHGTVSGSAKLKGRLKLPDTTTTMQLAGVGLANVTIGFAPTKLVTGRLNIGSMAIKATSTQYILVRKVNPLGLPVNLVGNACQTSTPVSIAFNGQIAPTGVTTVSGTYTIPSFSNCGGLAAALDLAVSGSGNTFSATLTPLG